MRDDATKFSAMKTSRSLRKTPSDQARTPEEEQPPVRAAIDTRISKDPHRNEAGVARQFEDCSALAERLGWQIVTTYCDDDFSAFNGKTRPDFEAMLAAMKRGEFSALLCWHTDRLYRSMKDLERLIAIADERGVQLRTVNSGDLDLSTSAGKMVARILGSVAHQESEHKGERQRRANLQRAAEGKWLKTGRRSFGYTPDGQVYGPEAAVLRQAAADVLAERSLRSIANEWNAWWAHQQHRGAVVQPHAAPRVDEPAHRRVGPASRPDRRQRQVAADHRPGHLARLEVVPE